MPARLAACRDSSSSINPICTTYLAGTGASCARSSFLYTRSSFPRVVGAKPWLCPLQRAALGRAPPDLIRLPVMPQPDEPVSYTHLRAHETPEHLVCRLLL